MQDGGAAGVQEVETLQDLEAPATQQLQLHLTEATQVPEHTHTLGAAGAAAEGSGATYVLRVPDVMSSVTRMVTC